MLFKISPISYIRVTFNLGKTQLSRMWSKRVVNVVRRSLSVQLKLTVWQLQECIPVGCVPPTAVAVSWGHGGVCLSACWDTPIPLPPWMWAWRPPPRCGPGDLPSQTPQAPPWAWAWKPARHAEIPPARHAEIPPPPLMHRILDTRY